jgi:hypothetical protein
MDNLTKSRNLGSVKAILTRVAGNEKAWDTVRATAMRIGDERAAAQATLVRDLAEIVVSVCDRHGNLIEAKFNKLAKS